MSGPKPVEIRLSEAEESALKKLVNGHKTGQQIALRAQIVLAAGQGKSNSQRTRGEHEHSALVAG